MLLKQNLCVSLCEHIKKSELAKNSPTQQITVAPDSAIRSMYTKVPFPIDFRIYVFNVTNKDEVTKGGKPKLQQVGPYYFE